MIRFFLVLLVWPALASAQVLSFPSNARLQTEIVSLADSYVMPRDIWDRGEMPTQTVEGQKTVQAWRIGTDSLTVLQMARPLREQLLNDGYAIIFECQTEACGGFDFRFAIEALPPPDMQINIGDFRFLAAEKRGADPEYITLILSRTAGAGFVQVTHVGPFGEAPLAAAIAPAEGIALTAPDLAAQLDDVGHAILDDLTFQTGSAALSAGPYASLQDLAEYLFRNPDLTVALVGHTDAAGSLEGNIALSKRRAASVLERLVTEYAISRQRLRAEGMGYLAPIANNLTEQGREANRRVEVIITSTNP